MLQTAPSYEADMRPMMIPGSPGSYELAHQQYDGSAYRGDIAARRYSTNSNSTGRPAECEDECEDRCGAEDGPPKPEHLQCGVDTRPLLPIVLAVSTVIGGLTLMLLQVPLFCRKYGISEVSVSGGFVVLYSVTLVCMTYATFCDPGQLRRPSDTQAFDGASAPPKRSHKSWQYRRPIRRYDHYCRWLSNCIALLNHREFLAMVVGLVIIAVAGGAIDAVLAWSMLWKGFWNDTLLILMHLGYSGGLLYVAFPILKIHVGLVSRNELAAEWKRNDFYIAKHTKWGGKDVPVNELSDDEYNELFEKFHYDKKRNSYDRGCVTNCCRFWCLPRWSRDELGEW